MKCAWATYKYTGKAHYLMPRSPSPKFQYENKTDRKTFD